MTDKIKEAAANFFQTVPNSHSWTTLEMLIHFLEHHKGEQVSADYLAIGLRNAKERGYEMYPTSDAAREDEAVGFASWLGANYDFNDFEQRWGKFWEDDEAGTDGFDPIEMPELYQLYLNTKTKRNDTGIQPMRTQSTEL